MMKRLLPVALIALSIAWAVANPLAAGTVEGLSAFARNDFAAAFRELLPEAKNGDAEAQIMLAILYAEGKGVRKDAAEAVNWLKQAAPHQPDADYVLGDIYSQDAQLQNPQEAVQAYRRAAERGFAPAYSKLGMMYLSGMGVTKDTVEAVVWLSLAAERGAPGAVTTLEQARKSLSPEDLQKVQLRLMEKPRAPG